MYNIPLRTNNNLKPETLEILSRHPRIVGIKDTVSDMARSIDVLWRLGEREDFAYFHGNELLALPAILYGARGMVPSIANFEPRLVCSAYTAVASGRSADLPQWQNRIHGLMRIFTLLEKRAQESTTLRLQAIKGVLEMMGICGSHMAQLGESLTPDDQARIRRFMSEENLRSVPVAAQ